MKLINIIFSLCIFSFISQSKEICQIKIAEPSREFLINKQVNEKLKPHQKLSHVLMEYESDDSNLVSTKNQKKLKILFFTLDGKKFESVYDPYHREKKVWKINSSKTQIFPELFKNYSDVIPFQENLAIRFYDTNDKNFFLISYSNKDCSDSNSKIKPKLFLGSRAN
ncbi:MAG: hypothetical protein HUU56_12085 [Bdellovibrionaceae bacterium]|nr:hypothetical protein [Pseudobdellovibrionaceae bacterium]